MNENTRENNHVMEIDLQRLIGAVWHRIWIVAVAAVLCAVISFTYTFYMITPQYQSAAMFYVNNSSISVGEASLSISSGDLVTSRGLVDSYIVILNTRTTLNDVIDYAGVDRTYGEVKGMVSAEAVDETEIFRVTVTSPDPEEADKIADAIAYILPKRISSVIEGTSAKVVDASVVAANPSSPNHSRNTMIGFLLGVLLSVAVIVLRELFDVTIRTEEDVTQVCKHPILASVPDMTASGKGGYSYGYGSDKKQSKKKSRTGSGGQFELIGKDISFAASEAYKLLRTKLQFSFADDNKCRVIGLSSALSGEGKSLTAVNLAYTLSQLDKKVLLIDCDMRRPTLAEKLGVQKRPGLSDYLTGQSKLETLIQQCGIKDEETAFGVVAAGPNPPNPIELLSSARMAQMLEGLRESYDYVILDLPPVGEVSDSLAVAKVTDGMLLVVRQDYCNRVAFGDTVRQFEFIQSKILGVVYNCVAENGGKYTTGYYKKYYKKYYREYRSYESRAQTLDQRAAEQNAEKKPAQEEKPAAGKRVKGKK